MAIVEITDELKQLKKFEVKCKTCGSSNCKIVIEWVAYPSASWNNTTIICNDCNEDEICYESSY